jgi:hypothetical protein
MQRVGFIAVVALLGPAVVYATSRPLTIPSCSAPIVDGDAMPAETGVERDASATGDSSDAADVSEPGDAGVLDVAWTERPIFVVPLFDGGDDDGPLPL